MESQPEERMKGINFIQNCLHVIRGIYKGYLYTVLSKPG